MYIAKSKINLTSLRRIDDENIDKVSSHTCLDQTYYRLGDELSHWKVVALEREVFFPSFLRCGLQRDSRNSIKVPVDSINKEIQPHDCMYRYVYRNIYS